jgi:hypothetical protein
MANKPAYSISDQIALLLAFFTVLAQITVLIFGRAIGKTEE